MYFKAQAINLSYKQLETLVDSKAAGIVTLKMASSS